jgi:hypothetical protein
MKIYEINKFLKLSKTPYVTFTLKNGKVIMSGRGKFSDAFRRVYYYDRDYTPNDGASYLNAVVKCFRMSTRLAVILERSDTWYDGKYGTLEDIIKNQTMK